jgi:hypothetical protein
VVALHSGVDLPEVGVDLLLLVLLGHEPQRGADGVHEAGLHPGFGEHRLDRFGEAGQAVDTDLATLVRLSKMRWRIEHDYRELKDAPGLDHFEGRTCPGWNRHARLRRASVLDPGATTAPASQDGSLTLFKVVRELQTLLACWHGTCPVCGRKLPPDHPLHPP